MSKLFLVTGGAGFIGSHLVEELVKQGQRVRVIDNLSTGKKENIKPFLEEIEFVRAVDRYKRKFNRPFPTWSEILAIVKELGYTKDSLS